MAFELLAAVILIPFGLFTMMRGSEALNDGRLGPVEGGVAVLSGATMVLGGVALLLGLIVAGVIAVAAMGASTVVWVRQRRRAFGPAGLTPAAVTGRAATLALIAALLVAGGR